jgi:hypothetical protein
MDGAISPSGDFIALHFHDPEEFSTSTTISIVATSTLELSEPIPMLSSALRTALDENLPEHPDDIDEALYQVVAPVVLTGRNNLAWSPVGDRLAYVAAVERNHADVYIFDVGSQESVRLTSFQNATSILGWSPDGRWVVSLEAKYRQWHNPVESAIAVWATDVETGQSVYLPAPSQGTARVEVVGWLSSTSVVLQDTRIDGPSNLRVFDLGNRVSKVLYPGSYADSASATDQSVIAVVSDGPYYARDLDSGIYLISVSDAAITMISAEKWSGVEWLPGPDIFAAVTDDYKEPKNKLLMFTPFGEVIGSGDGASLPHFSPDGTWVAFQSTRSFVFQDIPSQEIGWMRLNLVDGSSAKITRIGEWDVIWGADSSRLFFYDRNEDTIDQYSLADGSWITIDDSATSRPFIIKAGHAEYVGPELYEPAPGPTPTHTPIAANRWFGMMVPIANWSTWTVPNASYDPDDPQRVTGPPILYGVMTSKRDMSCSVSVYGNPLGGWLDTWEVSRERVDGQFEDTYYQRIVAKDDEGRIMAAYFQIVGRDNWGEVSGRAYLVVEASADWEACLYDAEEAVQTIDPEHIPPIPIFG